MKEGEFFICKSDIVPKGKFILGETGNKLTTGEDIPNKDIYPIFASNDYSLADRLIALGIARKEIKSGKDLMIIINPEDDIQL